MHQRAMIRLGVLAGAVLIADAASGQGWAAWRDCVRNSSLQWGCQSSLSGGGLSSLSGGGLSSLSGGGRSSLSGGGLSSLSGGGLSSLAGGGQVPGRTRGFTAEQLRRMAVDPNYVPR